MNKNGGQMGKQKDPWWRLQDLVNDETRVAVHDEFIIRIDQAIKELEELKKEKWIDHNFNWEKIQPILNLLNELEDMNNDVYLPAARSNLIKIYETTTDEGIKKDASVKRLINQRGGK